VRRGTNDRRSAQAPPARRVFDGTKAFSAEGDGNTLVSYTKGSIVFAQGERATSIFCLHKGKVKLTALSKTSEEATVEVLGPGDVFGEGCLVSQGRRVTTATTLTKCSITRLTRDAVFDLMHKYPSFFGVADLPRDYPQDSTRESCPGPPLAINTPSNILPSKVCNLEQILDKRTANVLINLVYSTASAYLVRLLRWKWIWGYRRCWSRGFLSKP
jgi:hypothetical protein